MKRDARTKYRLGLGLGVLALGIAFGCGTLTADSGASPPDPDASTDAPSTLDAIQPFDAGDLDAAPTAFCINAGHHDLCSDFEGAADWTSTIIGPTSSPPPVLVVDLMAPSRSHALESQLELFPSPVNFHAAGLQKRTTPWGGGKEIPHVRIELDVDVVRVEPDPNHGAFLLQLEAPFFALQPLEVVSESGNLTFAARTGDAAAPTSQSLSGTASKGGWVHVVIDLPDRIVNTVGVGTVTIGAVTTTVDLPAYESAVDTFLVSVGLQSGSGGGAWTVRYDNVLLDWH